MQAKWLPTPAQAKELLKRGIIDQGQFDLMTATAKEKKAKGLKGMYQGGPVEGEGPVPFEERANFFNLTPEEKSSYLSHPSSPSQAVAQPISNTQAVEPGPELAVEPGPELAVGQAGPPATTAPPLVPVSQGFGQQQMALAEQARLQEARGNEEAAVIGQMQKEDLKRLQEQEKRQAEFQKSYDEQRAKVDQKVEALGSLEVDPKRYWNSKTTGDKILANIGIFLGSVGGAMQGTNDNPVLRRIEAEIDRDIDAQKGAISQKNKEADMSRGLLADNLDYFKNMELAKDATRLAYLKNSQLKLEQIAARYKGPEAKAKAAQLWGNIQTKIDATRENAMKTWANLQAAQNPTGTGEGLTDDQRKRYVPGYGLVSNEKIAGEVIKLNQTKLDADNSLNKLIAISDKDFASLPSNEKAEAQVMAQGLVGTLREMLLGPGTLSEPDKKFLEEIIANPTNFFSLSSRNKAKLQSLKGVLKNKVEAAFKAGGGQTTAEKLGITSREG